jgi:AraC-like DNA-binding protein
LQRAITASARSNDWSSIARDAGYYDQAHLIGDFRDLTGLTPNAFVARRAAP